MVYQMDLLDVRKEAKLEDALAMIKEKLSFELIARCTGLPLSEIEALGVTNRQS